MTNCDKCGSSPATPFERQMLCEQCKVWLYGMLIEVRHRPAHGGLSTWREIVQSKETKR